MGFKFGTSLFLVSVWVWGDKEDRVIKIHRLGIWEGETWVLVGDMVREFNTGEVLQSLGSPG